MKLLESYFAETLLFINQVTEITSSKICQPHLIGCRAATSLTDNGTEDGATDNVATLLQSLLARTHSGYRLL